MWNVILGDLGEALVPIVCHMSECGGAWWEGATQTPCALRAALLNMLMESLSFQLIKHLCTGDCVGGHRFLSLKSREQEPAWNSPPAQLGPMC